MMTSSFLFILALGVMAAMVLFSPFFKLQEPGTLEDGGDGRSQPRRQYFSCLSEKEQVLLMLQELDLDFNLGKVPSVIYNHQRNILLQRGAELLQQLEMLKEKLGNGNGADTTLNGEHRVRAASPKIAADEIEDMLADRRRARLELSAGFCARCGKPIQNSDQFCSTCGLAVE